MQGYAERHAKSRKQKLSKPAEILTDETLLKVNVTLYNRC